MTQKKNHKGRNLFLALAALAFLIAVIWAMQARGGAEDYASGLPVETAVIETAAGKTHRFNLEIAATPIDIEIGLMHRKHMPEDHGMMFQIGHPPREVSFWMKNTLIPLDMLFVAEDGRIVNIHHNARPKSLTSVPSKAPVLAVIEINGGRAEALGIAIGDLVKHPYFKARK